MCSTLIYKKGNVIYKEDLDEIIEKDFEDNDYEIIEVLTNNSLFDKFVNKKLKFKNNKEIVEAYERIDEFDEDSELMNFIVNNNYFNSVDDFLNECEKANIYKNIDVFMETIIENSEYSLEGCEGAVFPFENIIYWIDEETKIKYCKAQGYDITYLPGGSIIELLN
jgi:hypothetical protein